MKKILQPLTTIVFLACGLAMLFAFLFSQHRLAPAFLNADALYLPVLVDNLLQHNGKLSDWYLTPAPYLFPDFLIYFVVQLFSGSVVSQVAIFAVLQVALSATFIYIIYSRCTARHAGAATSVVTLLLICMGLAIGSAATLSRTGNAYAFIFLSAFHYGAFLAQLAFFAVALLFIDKARRGRLSWLVLLGLISFAAALSDSIFLIQLTVPFLIMLLWSRFTWASRTMFNGYLLVTAFVGGILGAISYGYLIPKNTKYPVEVDFSKLDQQLDGLIRFFADLFIQTPLIGIFLAVYYMVALGAAFYWPNNSSGQPAATRLRFLLVFSFVSAFVTYVATSLVTNLSSGPRYFIPFFYWPLVVLVLILAPRIRQAKLHSLSACMLVLIVFQLVQGKAGDPDKTQDLADANCIVNTIRASGLHSGVAAYWDAKSVQALSGGSVNVAQYTGQLHEHRWITSDSFYRKTYDFAVISENQEEVYKISRDKIVAANGNPRSEFRCGNKSLLAYAPGEMVLEKNLFRKAGDGHTWKACDLQTRIGHANAACEMEKQDLALSGHMTYGPYERLPAGRYSFEIAYASKEAGGTVGEWDVVLALPDTAKILRKGVMSGSKAHNETVGGEFVVSPQESMEKFEIRTLALPKLDLKIIHLLVRRVE